MVKESQTKAITCIGAGSWGTALSIHLARKGYQVRLYGSHQDQLDIMQSKHENVRYLPGIPFPEGLEICGDWQQAQIETEDVLLAIPSIAFRNVLTHLKFRLNKKTRFVTGTKGLDSHSYAFLSDVAENILGEEHSYSVLSGPSFATEVARELPTAVVIASEDQETATHFADVFRSPFFKTYVSDDLIGVQLGGAIKNIIAIAVGISDGLGFGANARSALITRGLAEMTRLGLTVGARGATFLGLSGVGDLVLTSTDDQSRNRRFGLALGRGDTKEDARTTIAQSVEGMHAAEQIQKLARLHNVDMPITDCVYHILHHDLSPLEAVKTLLSRDTKFE